MRNLACNRSRQLSLVALKSIARDVERVSSPHNRTAAGAARHSQRPRQPRRGVDQHPHPCREPSHIDRHRPPHLRTKDADNRNREHRRRSPYARHAYEDRDLTPQELTADDAAHSRTPVTARLQARATAERDPHPLHNEPDDWWHQRRKGHSQSASQMGNCNDTKRDGRQILIDQPKVAHLTVERGQRRIVHHPDVHALPIHAAYIGSGPPILDPKGAARIPGMAQTSTRTCRDDYRSYLGDSRWLGPVDSGDATSPERAYACWRCRASAADTAVMPPPRNNRCWLNASSATPSSGSWAASWSDRQYGAETRSARAASRRYLNFSHLTQSNQPVPTATKTTQLAPTKTGLTE